jgi:hypothetical protein
MFDPVLKDVADEYPGDWVGLLQRLLGLPVGGEIEIIQPNLPTGTVEADRVYRLSVPGPMLLHTEWESSSELGRPDRFLLYNTLLTRQTGLPVQTVVVLVRREANSSDLGGTLARSLPDGREYLRWQYEVVRLWNLEPADLLAHPGLTPLAPLSRVDEAGLPRLVDELHERWSRLPRRQASDLASATSILMGLRFDRTLIRRVFRELSMVKESVIYQDILQEGRELGRLDQARRVLIRHGSKRFGVASAEIRDAVAAITDLDRLDRMFDRVAEADDWSTVLATE